ncbi:MAG: hypothetical protein M0Q92_10410 [Methanoregula sp.]|nr:hypothetical protein [Methanoregula sp.]
MPREFRHLVMTNIRRIAHTPGEAECIARILLMQVILVCVAHAAQKTWIARRMSNGDPGVDTTPAGAESPAPGEFDTLEQGPADAPEILLRTLWECIAGMGKSCLSPTAGPVFPANTGTCH